MREWTIFRVLDVRGEAMVICASLVTSLEVTV
jgi:hypothetical protein